MRWRQDAKTGELIPIDAAARNSGSGAIHRDFKPFVSPIDGTIVSGRRQYDDHCKKHNVVNAAEFSPEHYEKAAQKRADHYEGRHTKQETYARRCELNETIESLIRKG